MSVRYTQRARASLQAILVHIAADDPAAAHRLVDGIVDEVERVLGSQPRSGRPGRVSGTREWIAHRNYIVAYRVEDDDGVTVLDVVHSARLWPRGF